VAGLYPHSLGRPRIYQTVHDVRLIRHLVENSTNISRTAASARAQRGPEAKGQTSLFSRKKTSILQGVQHPTVPSESHEVEAPFRGPDCPVIDGRAENYILTRNPLMAWTAIAQRGFPSISFQPRTAMNPDAGATAARAGTKGSCTIFVPSSAQRASTACFWR
jgi:hypothetical protein